MKWIAVDYGERRTGLAVCDASELIVTPVTPQIEEKSLNKVAEAAAAARLAQGAEGVVCGLPRNMDGTEGSRCVKSRRFAARLATACGVPVVLWDERRTTVTAAGSAGWAGASSFAGAAASAGCCVSAAGCCAAASGSAAASCCSRTVSGVCSCMVLSNLPQSLRQGKISDSALSAASSQDSR